MKEYWLVVPCCEPALLQLVILTFIGVIDWCSLIVSFCMSFDLDVLAEFSVYLYILGSIDRFKLKPVLHSVNESRNHYDLLLLLLGYSV